jgi:hypothetical protein
MILEHVIHDWHAFRRALRSGDRSAFDAMMLRARQHASAASNAARLNPTEALFMAILVEHEKELSHLKVRNHVQNTQATANQPHTAETDHDNNNECNSKKDNASKKQASDP